MVVGGFFGDEGKGKIVSYLSLADKARAGVRGGVGPNAGHSVLYQGRTFGLRQLPSAVVNEEARLLIGPGVLVDPQVFRQEMDAFNAQHRTRLDARCALIQEDHVKRDREGYLRERIDTTGTGTGPANADRVLRFAKVAADEPSLQPYLTNVSDEVNSILDAGELVIAEGTQGTFLSLYHGTYPYVTSKDVTSPAICSDIGVGPKRVDEVFVVFKAYVTRVGSGPLQGELPPDEVQRRGWSEFGTVTGRPRRVSPFDFELARKAVRLNSATSIAITKLDALYPEIRGGRSLRALPREAHRFIEEVEAATGVPVVLIGTGPDTFDIIDRRRR